LSWWTAAALVPAAAWLYIVAARAWFWTTTPRLKRAPSPPIWPKVSVVVPARDEADMLVVTLPLLLDQDYPGVAEVVLVDDVSTDSTAETARAAASAGGRIALQVVAGVDRPPGWVGKTWALHQGVDAATAAADPPEFLLLTDADIAHPPDSLARLVSSALDGRRDLVSLMARLRAENGWEKLIIPSFVYFFALLYPFRRVARRSSRVAAAAGGCVLVSRSALERAGGIEAISSAVIDDVSLARAVKGSGGSIWLGFADDVESVRAYPALSHLWAMVARSAYTQLRYSVVVLAGTLAGLAVVYLGPLIVLGTGIGLGDAVLVAAGSVACAVMTASYVPMVVYYRLNPAWALTLPVAASVYSAMTLDSARRHWRGDGAEWKGRSYAGTLSA
jgi:hopene-associated glycosyltransferase HpnB